MKQGLNFHLAVNFDVELKRVEKIEFVFSKAIGSSILKSEVYPNGRVMRSQESGSNFTLLVPFTRAETYAFPERFYMDTRITLKDSPDQPETPIIELEMNDTLFEKDDLK